MSALPDDTPRYRLRPNPQVSANQMAEYLFATPTRRKSIIREARFPKTATVALYDHAREGLVKFLADDTRSLRHLAAVADAMEKRHDRAGASEWTKRDSKLSIEALDTFQRAYNKYGLAKVECRAATGRQPLLDMWPTKVSVHLDVIARIHGPGRDKIGGAVLIFSKGEASSSARIERSRIVAGLIYTFCTRFMAAQGEPDPSLCLSVDVLNGASHRPPGTFARRLKNVEDACDEIAALWRTIHPPADYDGPDPD